MSAGSVVVIQGLSVQYGAVRALDALDLELPAGPVGLLGPNGAGKTTLLRVLLGHQAAGGARVRVAGEDPSDLAGRLAIRGHVGYMPEGECLLPGMNGVACVAFLARLAGLHPRDAMTRAHEVLDYVGFEENRYRAVTGYSVGMKQRLKLAQALVHDPPILLLDEPTNGLDPGGRAHMLELIHDLGHEHGKNVVLCSHLLPDIERTCAHVVVLDRGRVTKAGSMEDLTRTEGRRFRLRFKGDGGALRDALTAAGLSTSDPAGDCLEVALPEQARDVDELFACAAGAGAALVAVESIQRSLEDVFLEVVEHAG